jgi:rRNA processing protein Gar1
MKSLGEVKSISGNKLVLRTDDVLKIGTKIFDEHGNFVGNVVEYFGSTKHPYVLVSPKKSPDRYSGKELFW